MNNVEREGFATLLGRLAGMGRGAVRAVRAGVRAGQQVLENGMASVALRAKASRVVNGHEISPGGLANSMGSTMGRTKANGSFDAKTGLAVGKGTVPLSEQVTKGKRAVAYGHWQVLGTQTRETGYKSRKLRSGKIIRKRTGNAVLNRGRVSPHAFIVSGAASSKAAAEAAVLEKMENQVARHMAGNS